MVTTYSGPIPVTNPGDLEYADLSLPIGGIKPHKTELLLFGGMIGDDLGTMPNSAKELKIPMLSVKENVFSVYEHDVEQDKVVEFDAAASAGTRGTEATYTFVSTAPLFVGAILRNMTTDEQFLVTEVVTSTTAKLQPGFSRQLTGTSTFPGSYTNDTTAAVADGQKAEIVGSVQGDGELPNKWKYTKPSRRVNNIQTVSYEFDITGAQLDAEDGTKIDTTKFNKRVSQMTYDWARDVERAMFLSQGNVQTVGSVTYRTMKGVYNQIGRSVAVGSLDGTGTALSNDKLAHMGQIAGERTNNSGFKVALTSDVMLRHLNKLAESNHTINVNPGADEVRLKTFKVHSQFQNLEFVEYPLMSKIDALKNQIIVLDFDNLVRLLLKNGAPRIYRDVETKRHDKRVDLIRGRVGVQLAHPDAHIKFTGFDVSFS
jgi:hypothetical protein